MVAKNASMAAPGSEFRTLRQVSLLVQWEVACTLRIKHHVSTYNSTYSMLRGTYVCTTCARSYLRNVL